MKHIVLFLILIFSNISYSMDFSLHGDVNKTNTSYDLGLDLINSSSSFYFTTGLYRDQKKQYKTLIDSEGLYLGFGRHFKFDNNISIAANTKLYENSEFSKPIYCLRITKIINLF